MEKWGKLAIWFTLFGKSSCCNKEILPKWKHRAGNSECLGLDSRIDSPKTIGLLAKALP